MKILNRSSTSAPRCTRTSPSSGWSSTSARSRPWPTGRLGAGFVDALIAALPGLHEHGCSYREPGGFIRRMREDDGTWLGHVLEHVAIELQNIAGEDVTFGKTRSIDGRPASTPWSTNTRSATKASRPASWRCSSVLAAAGRHRPEAACPTTGTGPRRATIHPLRPAPRARALDRFAGAGRRRTRHPVAPAERADPDAARPRQVPAAHPGHRHRPHPHIAVELAQDKEETNKILANLGLPVPRQELVQHGGAGRARGANASATRRDQALNGNHGRGSRSAEDRRRGGAGFAKAPSTARSSSRPSRARPPPAGGQRRAGAATAHAGPRGRRRRHDRARNWSRR